MEPDTAIRVVANYVGGIPEGNEYVFPYALKGDGGNPHALYGWVVPDSLAGPVEVRAIVHYNDTSVKRDTIVGVIEIENPTEPPDTVPPVVPPDTVPPVPGDSVVPEPATGIQTSHTGTVFTISWIPSVTEEVYDSIYYLVKLTGLNTTFPSEAVDDEWWRSGPIQCFSSHTSCEGGRYSYVVEPVIVNSSTGDVIYWCLTTQATKPDGLGLGIGVQECGEVTVPPTPGDSTGLALYASPWHDVYLVSGDTIMDGGYSLGVIKADSGPVVADSVWFYLNGEFHQLADHTGGSFHAGFSLNNAGGEDSTVVVGWRVFGGEHDGYDERQIVVSDHWGGNLPIPTYAELSTPTNLRIDKQVADTSKTLIAWDAIPEDSQCFNDFGTPVNCSDTYGDEVYYRVASYVVWPVDALEPGRSWFDTRTAMASTQRSFPWDYPGPGEVLPDSIRFCVLAEAWDCSDCEGPGGKSCKTYSNDPTQEVCGPISETACSDVLEVN